MQTNEPAGRPSGRRSSPLGDRSPSSAGASAAPEELRDPADSSGSAPAIRRHRSGMPTTSGTRDLAFDDMVSIIERGF